jgi:hypothetical protein
MKLKYAIFQQYEKVRLVRILPDGDFDTEQEAWAYASTDRYDGEYQPRTILPVAQK